MLLYVNKKEERRKKIKLFTLIFSIIFFILSNACYLILYLHKTDQTLTSYTQIKQSSDITPYTPITIYQTASSETKAIVIPKKLNKINTINIASALKLSNINNAIPLYFTEDVENKDFLQKLAKTQNLITSHIKTAQSVIITTDLKTILPLIYEKKLYPKTLTKQTLTNKNLSILLDSKFPPISAPKTTLEKEKYALEIFANTHSKELKQLLNKQNLTQIPFKKQDALLKNLSLCIQTTQQTICDTTTSSSLINKISKFIPKIALDDTIQKIILLTSFEEITPKNFNKSNGLLFRFEKREALLLPTEITETPFQTVKQKLGINPTNL